MRSPYFRTLVCIWLAAETALAQNAKPGDWPLYSRDAAGTRFSPLTQITTANVPSLGLAWSYKLASPAPANGKGAAPRLVLEATPVAIDGVVYLNAGRRVYALDGATGKELWTHETTGPAAGRGVGYWPGDRQNPPRILYLVDSKMFALNATTGKPDPGFGKEGVVDVGVNWNGVPFVFRNLVILGAYVGEVPKGPPGDTRAYDARTGAKVWEFHSVPRPGELGHDSWEGESWRDRSGTNIWGWYLTADEERGIVYMPLGSPAPNYYGGDRKGNNLFGNSIVAVDANTGKYKWHFQTIHHDLWDADLPPAPGLVDLNVNGRKIPALAQIGKAGYLFILDRTNGKPVFGVEERPVPAGNVPGEWYSPTQPFPLKPGPLARVSFKKEDIVTADDTTPQHAAACLAEYERAGGFYNAGPYTPFLLREEGAPPKSTIQFPGGTGGVNWGGTATDPRTGFIYMNSHDGALTGWLEKRKPGLNYGRLTEGSDQLYDRASINGPGPYNGFSARAVDAAGKVLGNWPCQKGPWGRLIAVNGNTGEIAWETPLGVVEGLPAGKQNIGQSGSAGPTVTAGGLVFIGATGDRRLRAFDSKTGKELWQTTMEAQGNANPMVYQGKNGKQYVGIVAGDTVNVYGLP